jgi:hypothetical protein
MKIISFENKRFGKFDTMVDDKDFDRLNKLRNLKWCVVKKRGHIYFQKRLPGLRLVELHRWIMGEPVGLYVDHINNNTLDNRRSNLRICTNSANLRNGRKRSNNTSGNTGVSFVKRDKKWSAVIRVKYKVISLGRYFSFDEAVKARKEAEIKYWNI